MAPYVLCWDFDHTLFGYQQETPKRFPLVGDSEFAGYGLRPGIEQTLERLARAGYMSDITTSGSLDYVTRALRATGGMETLRHIQHVFTGSEISVGAGKVYQPAAQAHALSDEDASERLIVIGDMYDDQPADLARVVFIRQPYGHLRGPRVVEAVIGVLRDMGNGNLHTGFGALYCRARHAGRRIPHGGLLAMSFGSTVVCCDEVPPHPPRRMRLGDVPAPTVTLLEAQ